MLKSQKLKVWGKSSMLKNVGGKKREEQHTFISDRLSDSLQPLNKASHSVTDLLSRAMPFIWGAERGRQTHTQTHTQEIRTLPTIGQRTSFNFKTLSRNVSDTSEGSTKTGGCRTTTFLYW